jgi:hypothetical protein
MNSLYNFGVLSAFLCACSTGLAECKLSVSPDPSILSATESAINRWNQASGCNIQIADGGIPVRPVESIFTPDNQRALGRYTCNGNVSIEVLGTSNRLESIIVHELGHAISGGCESQAHSESGVMTETRSCDQIDEASLNLICDRVECTAFNPEPTCRFP